MSKYEKKGTVSVSRRRIDAVPERENKGTASARLRIDGVPMGENKLSVTGEKFLFPLRTSVAAHRVSNGWIGKVS
jgi:hypothetical protein